jgi:xylulokinase
MPAAPDCILAIDLGTSGPKVALTTGTGDVLGWERESTPVCLLPDGGAEQDPADWWAAITAAVRRLLAHRLAPVERLRAVVCTAQWSGTVPVDGGGQPLGRAIIWMDSRGAEHARRITAGPIAIEGYGVDKVITWLRITGGIPAHSGKDSIAHILYLQHAQPDVYRAAACFLEPKDYLNLCLTGRRAASYDSISLHWLTDNRDPRRIAYHPALIRLAGIDAAKLPPLKSAVDVLGPLRAEVAAEWGVPAGVPVVMGTPDIVSAAIGSGAVDDFAPHLYLGTSAWLSCHVPFKKSDLLHNMASLPAAIPGRYFVANEQESAGACLTYLRDHVFFAADDLGTGECPPRFEQRLDRLAATAPPGSDGTLFLPWLNGERTPVEDAVIRGGFVNQSLRSTRADLVRAVYEGVAFNARWLLGTVEQFTGRRMENIHAIGGGANSDIWCQIHADVLNRTVRQMRDPILANVRGAAFLAAVALGRMTFGDVAARVPVAHTYSPTPELRRRYDAMYREFRRLYGALRPTAARLASQQ